LASGTAATSVVYAATPQPSAVPPIPELPDVSPAPSTIAQTNVEPTAPAALPTGIPADIPTARYPDQPAADAAATTADVGGSVSPSNVSTNVATAPIDPSIPMAQEPVTPVTPEEANQIDGAAANLSSQPLAGQQNPLRQSPDPREQIPLPAGSDRYTAETNASPPPAVDPAAAAAQASFANSWPTIQSALHQGELARAHELLSQWYNDPTLTPTDAELVNNLLSQLAGTVIYSNEHQLEPAYVVKPGDSLETIARECNVPWQLLAKINGIPAADQVQPGQELKIIRGPFSAVIDVGLKQLTLMVGDRYAGKFPVTVPSVAAVSEGQWVVDQKLVGPAEGITQSAYTPGPAAVDRAIVLRSDASAGPAASGATLTIASGSSTGSAAAIRVSPQDAEELSDILSIGSRIVIQR
jgi:LysM repeat protein